MANNHRILIPTECMVPHCGKALPIKPAHRKIGGMHAYCCNELCLNDYEYWIAGFSVRNMKTPQ